MPQQPLQSVVIVGGGTAGWMTAASLAHRLAPLGVTITLIESSEIGTIGVGEATVPAIRNYFKSLNLDTFELMKATNATFKLGITFKNWRHDNHRFFHSFGRYGIEAGPVAFHDLWMKLREVGEPYSLDDYCLATQLAYAGRYAEADAQARVDFEVFDWAIHFDATLFARYLRTFAESRGVTRIDARITEVQMADDGHIASVRLDDGRDVAGELFVDCSGFRGLLIQGACKAGFEDWSRWLVCDRAVAMPCAHRDSTDITPYTRSKAMTAGWTWRIPLQNRVGNGYVYSSAHISDADAEAALRAGLDGEALNSPNFVRFTPGHAKTFWQGNCVAIGLSGGFLEPLESTSITLIQVGIDKLIAMWPTQTIDPRLVSEYNRQSAQIYERIRDFIIVHYALNQRTGEPLWDYCRAMELPDTLSAKIEMFKARGAFVRYEAESFFDPSWLCMYEGFDVLPATVSPFAGVIPIGDLQDMARQMRADIKARAMDAETHYDFVRRHCGALEDE